MICADYYTVHAIDATRNQQYALSTFYAIDTTCYRHYMSVAPRHLLRYQFSLAVLVTTRLGVLVLISHHLLPLLCFSLSWLLLVVALLLPFIILLCGS